MKRRGADRHRTPSLRKAPGSAWEKLGTAKVVRTLRKVSLWGCFKDQGEAAEAAFGALAAFEVLEDLDLSYCGNRRDRSAQ